MSTEAPAGQLMRHPAEITSVRLASALDVWPSFFDGRLRDMVGEIRAQLDMIAESQPMRGERRLAAGSGASS